MRIVKNSNTVHALVGMALVKINITFQSNAASIVALSHALARCEWTLNEVKDSSKSQ